MSETARETMVPGTTTVGAPPATAFATPAACPGRPTARVPSCRGAVVLITLALLAAPAFSGDPPTPAGGGNRITLPNDDPASPQPPPDNPALRQAIDRALRGDKSVTAPEPLADGLIDAIRDRKSVLEGSLLDPAREKRGGDNPAPPPLAGSTADVTGSPADGLPQPSPSRPSESGRLSEPGRQHWLAAELLLKTARLIDKLDPADENRQRLVNQMRREAVRLLTGAASESPAPLPPAESPNAESAGAEPAGTDPPEVEVPVPVAPRPPSAPHRPGAPLERVAPPEACSEE
jgi:hypothetical protein